MPIGILINGFSVVLGGLIGGLFRSHIPERYKQNLPLLFGFVAMAIGISKIQSVKNITVMVLALIFGYIIGEMLGLEKYLNKSIRSLVNYRSKEERGEIELEYLVLAIVTFCFSGTGIFGALTEGFSGDSSILIAKAILDLFTSMIFASIVGIGIAWIALPQVLFLGLIFWSAHLIVPWMDAYALGNFMAVGGVLTMMVGFKMSRLIRFPVANALPAIVLVLLLTKIIF